MSNIKKAFIEIIELLEANENKKVKSVLEEVKRLASKSTSSNESVVIRNEAKEVVAIKCYYFKRFMPIIGDSAVEFGNKASSATGLNSMCKAGNKLWTKQQRVAKQAKDQLLPDLFAEKITTVDIERLQEEIEVARKVIEETDLGFATKEECEEYLVSCNID